MRNLKSLVPWYRWTALRLVSDGLILTYLQHGAGTLTHCGTIQESLNVWEEISVIQSILRLKTSARSRMLLSLRIAIYERLSRLTFSLSAGHNTYPPVPVSQRVR